ncbi:MAG: type II toxin-antitoxin system MqsA family antitoxin [Methanoregula sp.]|jgi:YgiT-type zinc finger domain-containing protein|nr:type II toxin-antitoxin system MqsA family antitoxin [Methanoregula sp.]
MARLKTEKPQKLLLKTMKEKFAETEKSTSSVFAGEAPGKSSKKTTSTDAQKVKGKKITQPSPARLDHCALCNGKLEKGTTEFMARTSGEVVIINDVPALVCEQCGEAYYSVEISRKIDAVMREAHQKKLCVRPVPAGEVSLNS